MAEREFHAVADLFPLLEGAAFDELAADIKKNGLREAILIDADGRIVDGRNRYRACLAAGVEPRFVEWQGEGELAELALSLNLRRRHLDESQRALVAARLAKLMEKEAVKRKDWRRHDPAEMQGHPPGESRIRAGAQVNVSPRLVSYALKILKDGSEELIGAVESGGLAVTPGAALARLPHGEQAKAVAGGVKHAAAKARELRGVKSAAAVPPPSPGRFGVLRAEMAG